MLGTDSEDHLGFVQAAAHEHLLPGNMDWAVTRRKVLRAFYSAGLKCSCSSPEWITHTASASWEEGVVLPSYRSVLQVFVVFFPWMQFPDHWRVTTGRQGSFWL